MPFGGTIRVRGYREFLRASDRAGRETKSFVRATYREVGEIVRVDASSRFSSIDTHTAAGYRTSVRVRGVAVRQSLRKTTGLRPQYGSLQMRLALLPALAAKSRDVEKAFEKAIDKVADHFEE